MPEITDRDYWPAGGEPKGLLKLRVTPYNARLIDARKERSWTQKNLSDLTGVSTSYLGHIETLRAIPTQDIMVEISAALDLPQDYLFPEVLIDAQREGLFDHRVAYLEEQHIIRLTEGRRAHLLPPHITDDELVKEADRAILKTRVAEVITTLTPREQKVIELRFGLEDGISHSTENVGRQFGLSRERIRQIEAKALLKLRHPSRSRKLKDFLE